MTSLSLSWVILMLVPASNLEYSLRIRGGGRACLCFALPFLMHMRVYATGVQIGACGGQWVASEPPELELEPVVSHHPTSPLWVLEIEPHEVVL